VKESKGDICPAMDIKRRRKGRNVEMTMMMMMIMMIIMMKNLITFCRHKNLNHFYK